MECCALNVFLRVFTNVAPLYEEDFSSQSAFQHACVFARPGYCSRRYILSLSLLNAISTPDSQAKRALDALLEKRKKALRAASTAQNAAGNGARR